MFNREVVNTYFYQIPSHPDALDSLLSHLPRPHDYLLDEFLPQHPDIRDEYFSHHYVMPKVTRSVEDFVKEQTRIRILFDYGQNYGNQAASINLLNRLRQMGFRGIVEFIYPGRERSKLHTLADDQPNAEWISYADFIALREKNRVAPITLGLSGAMDFTLVRHLCGVEAHNSLCRMPMELEVGNLAAFLNTDVFVQFSSFYRNANANTWLFLNKYPYHYQRPFVQEGSGNLALVTPIATLADAKEAIAYNERYSPLATLISLIENKTINFFAAYGHPLQQTRYAPMNVLLGASFAQQHGPSELQKPLVVGLFYEATLDIPFLFESYRSPSTFSFRFLEDGEETTFALKKLKDQHMLILSMGSLPKRIFDGLFTYTADNVFPPVLEGASTLTSVLRTGRPHIHCAAISYFDHWVIDTSMASLDIRERLKLVDRTTCPKKADNTTARVIGEYIIDAHNRSSSLSLFFKRMGREAAKPGNDRIEIGLTAAMRFVPVIRDEKEIDFSPIAYHGTFTNHQLVRPPVQKQDFKMIGPHYSTDIDTSPSLLVPLISFGLYKRHKQRNKLHPLTAELKQKLELYQQQVQRLADILRWQQQNRLARAGLIDDKLDFCERKIRFLIRTIKEVLETNKICVADKEAIETSYERLHETIHHIAKANREWKQLQKKQFILYRRGIKRTGPQLFLPQPDQSPTAQLSQHYAMLWQCPSAPLVDNPQSSQTNRLLK